jgi:hypothetical protein
VKIEPEHVTEAVAQVRLFLKKMAEEIPVDQVSDEVIGQDLRDRWERMYAELGVDRSAARSLLVSVQDVMPWRVAGLSPMFFQAGVAVALLARKLADEQIMSSRPLGDWDGAD